MDCTNCGEIIVGAGQFCSKCGEPVSTQGKATRLRKRVAKVKSYVSRRAVDRDVQKMVKDGWCVESQSGHFNQRFWLFRSAKDYLTDQNKVTVTFVRG